MYYYSNMHNSIDWTMELCLSELTTKMWFMEKLGQNQTLKPVLYFLPTYHLKNLTMRVEIVESGPDQIELREFELLVTQLKDSLNSSSPMFDSLYTEIRNMSLTVNQLESYDKSNLEEIRIEFGKLQKKLEDYLYFPPGSCNHKGIASVGKPVVSQLNANLNAGYRFGGWGKDSKPSRGFESMYWYGAYSSASGTGNNYIVHGNTLYYQKNSPFSMAKLNLTTSKYDYRVIEKASATFSYSFSANQNMDFSDEFGIEDVWSTGVYKSLVGNTFMVCGVLYATRPVDVHTEEIFYSYDTKTEQENYLRIPFEKFQDEYLNLHYNPIDQKIYMYNKGYYVPYSVKPCG
uniref:Olfactomedin-like domain-containing protein n=1 Tax=Oncorhynchus tshawytscha TaxID=74940 RepID=A0A8C8CLQ9_ONCTS